MARLCRCGAIVEDRCEACDKAKGRGKHQRTTKERGYGHDWRNASERYRAEVPLCQVCELAGKVAGADHVHHITKIRDAPELRLDRSNWLSVCSDCHEKVEKDSALARRAKRESTQDGRD